jgi:branched-chain amino acid transport system ATP-binding protein
MLDVQAIDTWRGPAQILRRVSLNVASRESVCLVGRNGAGKTTTIDSIIGLLPLRGGKIAFQGREIGRLPPHQRARLGIGYAPEDAGLFTDLTVAENFQVCRWMAEASDRKDQVSEAETDARIFSVFPEVRKFTARRGLFLSGGEKKMVAIARAMALSPAVLLLDEPFEGLAPLIVRELVRICGELAAAGQTILLVEQNLAATLALASRVYIISNGHVAHQGPAQEIRARPELLQRYLGI